MEHGLLLIDKETGCTSHDVVAQARRILRQKKIGHCGTLDPDATGLLVLTLGRATRLTRFLIKAPKVYEGLVRFGLETDTYDLSGTTVAERPTDDIDGERLARAMESFEGTQLQTPPPFCAKKIQGVKFYELARRGEKVPDHKKEITIYEFKALDAFRPGEDLRFRMGCSSGTYARSLVHDLGQTLGCGAALAGLERIQVGSFHLDNAIRLTQLASRVEEKQDIGHAWIPFDDIPLPFGEIIADSQQERRIQHGQNVLVRNLEVREGDWIKMINQRQQLIAVGAVVERIGSGNAGVVQPKVVFH